MGTLVAAGCRVIQLRLKRLDDADRLAAQRAACRAVVEANASTTSEVVIVVNDRADLAAILADEAPRGVRPGLHLGQHDLKPTDARRVLGARADRVWLGTSTHNPDELAAATREPVDYVGFGPIRATTTKAADRLDPTVGMDGLAAAVAASPVPVAAIGGLQPSDVAAVRRAGARWIAMAGALWRSDDIARTVRDVQQGFS